MPIIDTTPELLREITSLGFAISNNFKLLELDINNKLDNVMEIYQSITEKIGNLIRFWERFKLTLPGRLTIMKTCLISQLNYIGCFLPMPDDTMTNIQRLIDRFVKKKPNGCGGQAVPQITYTLR